MFFNSNSNLLGAAHYGGVFKKYFVSKDMCFDAAFCTRNNRLVFNAAFDNEAIL